MIWFLPIVLLAGVNASDKDLAPILRHRGHDQTLPNMRVSLLKRLKEYEPHYCIEGPIEYDSLRQMVDSIEEAIKTVDIDALNLLDQILPVVPIQHTKDNKSIKLNCDTPIWTIFHYRKLLLSSSSLPNDKIDYTLFVKGHVELFLKTREIVKDTAMEILKNVNNEELRSLVQSYLDNGDFEVKLRNLRCHFLGDIPNPTAHQIARLLIHLVERSQYPSSSAPGFPLWMSFTLMAVHIIDDITSAEGIINNFLTLINNQKEELEPWFHSCLSSFVQKSANLRTVAKMICQFEEFIREQGGTLSLEDYIIYSKHGARTLALILRDADVYFFRNYPIEKLSSYRCQDQGSLRECVWELIDEEYNARITRYQPRKSTDEKFNNVTCKHEDFDFKNGVGKGTYGTVFRAIHKATNSEVAIKVTFKDGVEDMPTAIFMEEEITTTVQHENIASSYCSFMFEGDYYLVMPYYSGGSLYQKLGQVSEEQVVVYIQQILEGLMALHTHGFLHNDLKTSNLVLDHEDRVKIIDFGLSFPLQLNDELHRSSIGMGTYIFMPGEVLVGCNHGPATDIYSAGVIAWTLLEGKSFVNVFGGVSKLGRALLEGSHNWISSNASEGLNTLIATLTSRYPDERWQKVYVNWETFQKNPLFKSPWKGNPSKLIESSSRSPDPVRLL